MQFYFIRHANLPITCYGTQPVQTGEGVMIPPSPTWAFSRRNDWQRFYNDNRLNCGPDGEILPMKPDSESPTCIAAQWYGLLRLQGLQLKGWICP